MDKRDLTAKEIKTIKWLRFSPRVKRAVYSQWASEESSDTAISITIFGWLLLPVLAIVLWFCKYQPEHMITEFHHCAVVATWFFQIILLPLFGYVYFCAIRNRQDRERLGHFAIYCWQLRGLKIVGNVFSAIILITLLTLNGHQITACAYLIAVISTAVFIFLIKDLIRDAMDNINAAE